MAPSETALDPSTYHVRLVYDFHRLRTRLGVTLLDERITADVDSDFVQNCALLTATIPLAVMTNGAPSASTATLFWGESGVVLGSPPAGSGLTAPYAGAAFRELLAWVGAAGAPYWRVTTINGTVNSLGSPPAPPNTTATATIGQCAATLAFESNATQFSGLITTVETISLTATITGPAPCSSSDSACSDCADGEITPA